MFLSIQFKLSVQLSNMNIAGPDLVKGAWRGRGRGEVDGSCCCSGSQAGTALSWQTPSGECERGQEQASIVVPHHTGPFAAASGEGTHCSVLWGEREGGRGRQMST